MNMTRLSMLLVILAAVIGAALALPLQMLPLGPEQSFYAVAAHLMDRGAVLYRDIVDDHPPGVFLWFAALGEIGGSADEAARVAQFLWLLAICVIAAMLAYEWTGRVAAAAAACTLLALAQLGGGFMYSLRPERLAGLPLLLACGAWGRPGQLRHVLRAPLAGLALGVGALFDWSFAAVALTWVCVELAAQWPTGWKTVGRDTPLLVLGCIVPPGLFIGWLLRTGGWDAFLAAQATARLPADGSQITLLLVTAVMVLLAGLAAQNQLERPVAGWLAATLIVLWAAGEPRARTGLVSALLTLSAGIGIAGVGGWLAVRVKRRWVYPAVSAALLVAVAVTGPWTAAYDQWRQFGDYLAGEPVVGPKRMFEHRPTGYSYPAVRDAATVLVRRSPGGGSLLVWGDAPGLYQYSGFKPATPLVSERVLRYGDDRFRRAVFDTLDNRPPDMLVLADIPTAHGAAPLPVEFQAMDDQVRRIARDRYQPIARLENYRLFSRAP